MNKAYDEENKAAALHECLDREFVRMRIGLKREETESEKSVDDEIPSNTSSIPNAIGVCASIASDVSATSDHVSNSKANDNSMCLKHVIIILLFSLSATTIALIAALNKPCPNEENSLSENNNHTKKFGIEGDVIPVLLELPERSIFSISTALSMCLKLKSSNYNPRSLASYKNNSIDFFSANALCNLKKPDDRLRMVIVFQNPAIRIYEDYNKIISANYDKKLSNMNLTQYLDWPGTKDNFLVRSILCKNEGQITTDDFKKAQSFLDNNAVVFVSTQYRLVSKLFQKRFKPDLEEPNVLKCIDDQYKKSLRRASYAKHDISDYLSHMHRTNFYDFRTYQKFAPEEN